MNLLEFGMKNENSKSAFLRGLSGIILNAEIKRADRIEAALNKKNIQVPEEIDDEEMLKNIRKAISEYEADAKKK